MQELLGLVADGAQFEAAVETVYQMPYPRWLTEIDPVLQGEPTTTRTTR